MELRKSARASVRWGLSCLVAAAMLAGSMGGCDLNDVTGGGDTTTPPVTPPGGTTGGSSLTPANAAPALTFTKPNSPLTVYIGQTLQVGWLASDYDNSTVTTIYYDRDGLRGSGDETQLTQVQKGANDYSESSFAWNTSSLTPGTYHLLGTVSDGVNAPVTVYCSHLVTVASSTPTITLVEPFGPKSVMPAENLVINWTQYAPLAPSTVTLFYDTNTAYSDGIVNTITTVTKQPSDTGGSYVWNVPAVKSGQYYLGAVLSDGTHPATVAYAEGVLSIGGPAVQVYHPSTNLQWHSGGSVGIRYEAVSPHGGTVRIFYDRDGIAGTGDEVTIVQNLPVQAGSVTYPWTSPALPLGNYYIGVQVNDGVNDPVVAYGLGLIQELGPEVTVTAPTGQTNWVNGGSVNVTYKAYAASGTAQIFYDVDGKPNTGDEVFPPGLSFAIQNGVSVTQTLTVTALSAGTYYVGVKLTDGTTTAWGHAPGTIAVTGPTLQITGPSGPVTVGAGDLLPVTVQFRCDGEPSELHIFWDLDMTYTPADEANIMLPTPKAQPPTTAPTTDIVNVQIPLIPASTYRIGASLWVGGQLKVVAHSTSSLVINGPTLNLTRPAVDVRVLPGSKQDITWSNQLPAGTTITLWYDDNQTYGHDDDARQIVADLPTVAGQAGGSYTWGIPVDLMNPPGGGYYIGATVTDILGQRTTVYSTGRFVILDRTFFSSPLAQVEALGLGRTFRGFSPNGQLGKVTAHVPWKFVEDPKDTVNPPGSKELRRQPGISTNGNNEDGNGNSYDDFVLTAPTANPFYLERVGAGESYLVLSDPAKMFTPPVVGPFAPISVSSTGSAKLPGTIFAGPGYVPTFPLGGTTSGISAVALSRPVAQDSLPALVFGLPSVSNNIQEEQDYDPIDRDIIDFAWPNPPGPTDYFPTFGDTYRQPLEANTREPDGNQINRAESGWYNVNAGMVVAVSGGNAPIGASITGPVPQEVVIPLDSAGQLSVDPHPRAVGNTGNTAPLGTRFYCPWMFNTFNIPLYAEWVATSLVGEGDDGNDLSRYGESVVEADLDGDGIPEWISTIPRDHTSGVVDQGWLHINWTYNTALWTAPLPISTPFSGSYLVTFVVNTYDPTGALVSSVVTQESGIGNDTRCWSWPLAFTSGSMTFTITIRQQTPPLPDLVSVSVSDSTLRMWGWPVLSDYIAGDLMDAATGNLGGLANVGDFNNDDREDITVGAPNGNPGGLANAGCSYLIFGRANLGDHFLGSIGEQVPGALAGLKIKGQAAGAAIDKNNLSFAGPDYGDSVGIMQASAGDFNGDGYSDWIIGIPGYNAGGNTDCGAAAIIYGSGTLQGSFNLSDIGTSKLPGVLFTGEAARHLAGLYAAGVGDVDGDGYDDVLVAAPGGDSPVPADAKARCGIVYLIYGGPDPATGLDRTGTMTLGNVAKSSLPGQLFYGPHAGDQIGTVAAAGDVNADGLADFLIGNSRYDILDPNGSPILSKVGEVYLIRGGPRLQP
jgi:hypothetical protein